VNDLAVDVVTVGVLGFVGYRVAIGADIAIRSRRSDVIRILRGIRVRHVLWALPTLMAVVTAAIVLVSLPVLSWGWWSALGGTGNPVTGSTDRTAGTALEWLVPIVFLIALLPALPLFAEREEQIFRLGAERRTLWGRWRRNVEFGLVHTLIGIPIGVALGLSLAGAAFTAHYLRGVARGGPQHGLHESTCAHTAYNGLIIIGFVLPLFVAGALGLW